MDDNAEEEVLRQLKWENRLLKERVVELEEKVRKAGATAGSSASKDTSVLKLLKSKDERLEKITGDLQRTIEELEKRNSELSLRMTTLKLYQEIFETDDAAMIAVNPEGKVVLFNRAAPQILGEKFRQALQQPVESADFRSVDPATPNYVRATLSSRMPSTHTVRVRDRRIATSVFPLGTTQEPSGALVKIAVLPGA